MQADDTDDTDDYSAPPSPGNAPHSPPYSPPYSPFENIVSPKEEQLLDLQHQLIEGEIRTDDTVAVFFDTNRQETALVLGVEWSDAQPAVPKVRFQYNTGVTSVCDASMLRRIKAE
jgi:hypothetical protein